MDIERYSSKWIEQTLLDIMLIYFNETLTHVVQKITQLGTTKFIFTVP